MDEVPLKVPSRTTTMSAGVFNLAKSAIGVGVLGLPSAMRDAGLALGLILLAFGSFTTSSTLHFLARIAANTDMGDYFGVGRMAYGPRGENFAVFITMLYLFGGLIAYSSFTSIYFGEFLQYVFGFDPQSPPFYASKYFIIALASLMIYPLACLRDLSKLAKASFVGMLCMTFVCGLTIIDYFLDSATVANATYTMFNISTKIFPAFATILFAFCNHFTMLAIIPQFVNPSPKRRSLLLVYSSTFILVFYFLMSLFGYLHFGDAVENNILLSRKPTTLAYAIAKLSVALVIICSYPLLCDPTKACINFLLDKSVGKARGAAEHVRNLVVTASLVGGSGVVAMFAAGQVLPILGVFSSLCGSLLMFVFPALYFLRLSDKYHVSGTERAIAYLDIGVGVVVLIFGTIFSVINCLKEFKLI